MAPIGYSIWLWWKSNPIAQGAAMALGALAVFWSWLSLRDRRRRAEITRDIDLKAEKTARRVTEKTRERTDEVIRQSEMARAGVPRGAPSGELPDDIQSILFDD